MKRLRPTILAGLAMLLLGRPAGAALIPVFSTGTTATGSLATPGTADVHYVLSNASGTVTSPAFVGTNLPPFWVPNTSASQWLSPQADASTGLPAIQYDYRTTFSMAGLNAATAMISGQLAADDEVTILFNNQVVYVNIGGPGAFTNFSLTANFRDGINVIDFVTTNVQSGSPNGLQVNILSATASAAAVPEPSSITLLGLAGTSGLAFARRRSRRRSQA